MKGERLTGWLRIQPRIKAALCGTMQNNGKKNAKSDRLKAKISSHEFARMNTNSANIKFALLHALYSRFSPCLRITNPKFPRFLRKFFIEIKFFSASPRLSGATGFSPCLSASVVCLACARLVFVLPVGLRLV